MDKDIAISKEEQPLMVTIQCITYNHEPYIRQCLDGFVMQKTNFRFEAIVHDDASTDGTAAIIREYAEKYPDIIKPIYETENQYSKHDGSLRRIMDAHTHGKYIAICEGDDYWIDPLKLQKQVDFLETHPDYSLCFHNAVVHYEDGKTLDHIFAELQTKEYSRQELLKSWVAPTASFVFSKDILSSLTYQKVEVSRKLAYGDLPLILSASYCGKVYGMNQCMSIYRIHAGGAMQIHHSIPIKLCIHQIECRKIFENDIRNIFNDKIGRHASIAISHLRHGNLKTAIKLWILAFRFAPLDSLRWTFKYFLNILR